MEPVLDTLTLNQTKIIMKMLDGYELHNMIFGAYLLKGDHCINIHRGSFVGLGKKKIIQWQDKSKGIAMISPEYIDAIQERFKHV